MRGSSAWGRPLACLESGRQEACPTNRLRSEGFHAFLHKSADALEGRVAGTADALENDRLARREHGAGLVHAVQGVRVIDAVATADSIDDDVDTEVQGQQIKGG